MSWTVPDQTGRTAVVTGGNAGLGHQVALALARAGASVVLACRSTSRGERAAAEIRSEAAGAEVSVGQLDLADLGSVTAFATQTLTQHDRLDLLLNNAGLMAVDRSRTVDGFETQLGVNHLGHFALTNQLLPLLGQTPGSRVVSMSSLGHRAGRMRFEDLMGERRYGRWSAYFQSKLANLLFTAALQRRLAADGSTTAALTAHPGLSGTDLGSRSPLPPAPCPCCARRPTRARRAGSSTAPASWWPGSRSSRRPRGGPVTGPRPSGCGRSPPS
jgi:protochlorophyllide reductase